MEKNLLKEEQEEDIVVQNNIKFIIYKINERFKNNLIRKTSY